MTEIDLDNYADTVAAFGGNEQRAKVFLDRYSKKDPVNGLPIEVFPSQMWGRVAVALTEDHDGIPDASQYNRFFNLLEDFKFVPGGRILAGAGIDAEVTYYNCYVIPLETKVRRQHPLLAFESEKRRVGDRVEVYPIEDTGSDSREAIFDTIGLMVDIMSRGGGVGINWSVLRPKGTYLKRVNGTTSGPVSWMDVASRAVGVVEQGGTRRGAAMFMIDDWHPDVEEFINAKRDYSLITNANVSVAVSDEFMAAVAADGDWTLRFPDTTDPRYNVAWDGDLAGWQASGGRVVDHKRIRARDLWRALAEAAWASGEPGVVFLDRYNRQSTVRHGEPGTIPVERIISVNPCGEQGLGPYSVCNLGAMNLAAYVGKQKYGKVKFEWSRFSADAAVAVEFLDRVIDENYYFIPENEAIQKQLRRIGLGVMGLADTLIALGLRYGDLKAVKFTEQVFKTMKLAAVSRSAFLAQRLGPAPAWEPAMQNSPYLREYLDTPLGNQISRHGLRNLFLLTQAPTGTTSILAGVNSGIEPYFAFKYTRKDRTGEHRVVAPIIEKLKPAVIQAAPGYVGGEWVTSEDVTVEQHIAMQAAAQRHIDSSVSKTINAPTEQTVEEVEKAFTLAYDSGLKGVAYFRDGSGRDQVLYRPVASVLKTDDPDSIETETAAADAEAAYGELWEANQKVDKLRAALDELQELIPLAVRFRRPDTMYGSTTKVKTAAGTAYVTVNGDEDGRPVEMFVNVGKAGSDIMELGEAIGRLASLALQSGSDLGDVAAQLVGIGGDGKFNPPLAHAIGVALLETNLDQAERKGFGYHDCEETLLAADMKADIRQAGMGGPDFTFDPDLDGEDEGPEYPDTKQVSTGQACPDCHNFSVVLQEGCKKCHLCGWSAC